MFLHGCHYQSRGKKQTVNKQCSNCSYSKPSKLKIKINQIPITMYCDNKISLKYGKYVWDDENCGDWKGADDE